ncbi:MAG: sigma factor-like helix-turn-helix DNA-binding protein [Candidatus Obscuribacterales bacterium]|nr:sigma factor-like helix-turn-helix DNA-binding protein [Candidatus Obscuribacterales bacterium]
MSLLPSRTTSSNSNNVSAASVIADLKKGDPAKRNDFVWNHQERFYAIAYLATDDANAATDLTISAFQNVFSQLKSINTKQFTDGIWDWLVGFIVDSCADWHSINSAPVSRDPRTDPSTDGSSQMDWETTIILGSQRVKRCIASLPQEQQKVFLLRHNFNLSYEQIAIVINQAPEDVMAWLFRARVQIVKCLGRG